MSLAAAWADLIAIWPEVHEWTMLGLRKQAEPAGRATQRSHVRTRIRRPIRPRVRRVRATRLPQPPVVVLAGAVCQRCRGPVVWAVRDGVRRWRDPVTFNQHRCPVPAGPS